MKEFELERSRHRVRLQALKEKVAELEAELRIAREDNERLQKGLNQQDTAKNMLQRKEQIISSLRAAVDRVNKELDEARQHEEQLQGQSEKRIKQLQRQIDSALRMQEEHSKEVQMLRERLAKAHVEQSMTKHSNTGSVSAPPVPVPSLRQSQSQGREAGSSQTTGRSADAASDGYGAMFDDSLDPLPPSTRPSSSLFNALHISSSTDAEQHTGTDVRGQMTTAASLQAARHDIQDVLEALGGHSSRGPQQQQHTVASRAAQALSNMSSPSTVSTGGNSTSQDHAVLNVERRLHALVNAALQSPARPTNPSTGYNTNRY